MGRMTSFGPPGSTGGKDRVRNGLLGKEFEEGSGMNISTKTVHLTSTINVSSLTEVFFSVYILYRIVSKISEENTHYCITKEFPSSC